MKKSLIIATLAIGLSGHSRATMVVIDPTVNLSIWTNDLVSQAKQDLAYLRQGEQYIQEKLVVLKETQQVENELLELSRLGNMQAVVNLPGVQNLTTAAQIVSQWKTNVAQIEGLANPTGYGGTANQILNAYGQPIEGIASRSSGQSMQGLFQFDVSTYQIADTTQQQIKQLMAQKAALIKDRDSAHASMTASTDQATQMKYASTVATLNGSIASIDAQISNAYNSEKLQQQKNEAASSVYRATVTQQAATSFAQEINQSVTDGNRYAPNDLAVPQWPNP